MQRAMPVILLGDLNEWFIYSRTLRRLVSHFYRVRSPRTFPTRLSVVRVGPHLSASG
jgi:endonuclease/exonuclease/phosphatase family metal-dependent hydrolase